MIDCTRFTFALIHKVLMKKYYSKFDLHYSGTTLKISVETRTLIDFFKAMYQLSFIIKVIYHTVLYIIIQFYIVWIF